MKEWIEKLKGGRREQIVILFLAGLLLLVIAMPSEPAPQKETEQQAAAAQTEYVSARPDQARALEERLEEILSHVSGLGETKVMITLKSDGRKLVEKDMEHSEGKEEAGTQEGTVSSSQSNSESTVYQKDAQGNEIPYVTEELEPEIEGVLVIAQGAGNASASAEITEAVMALFGVEAHKIKVMKME